MYTKLLSRSFRGALIASVIALAAGSPHASGLPINPGYDLFETGPATADVSLPAGFFGPGSDPFEGTVVFRGNPLAPPLRPTDTIVERKAGGIFDPPSPPPVVVPIEIVALNLVSVAPITVTYSGSGGELWDVRISIPPAPQPIGQMTIQKNQPNGGTLDATLPISPIFIFTRTSDLLEKTRLETDILHYQGVWSLTPGPLDAHTPSYPAGGLYAGIDPVTGLPHAFQAAGFSFSLTLRPAELAPIHEPAALGLIGVALLAMKKRRS